MVYLLEEKVEKKEKVGSDIVFLQDHDIHLHALQMWRKSDNANRIHYFRDPREALNFSIENNVDVIITEENFYNSNLESLPLFMQAVFSHPFLKYKLSLNGPNTGSELSDELYVIKPEILVLGFRDVRDERGKIIGELPKLEDDNPYKNLINLVDSNELKEILNNKDWKKFKQTFSFINFYEEFEKEH